MRTVSRWKTLRLEPKPREDMSLKTMDKPDTYFQQREQWLKGTSGAAGPCKRIDPKTGEVIEILEPKI